MSIEVSGRPLEDDAATKALTTDKEINVSSGQSSKLAEGIDDDEFCVALEPHEDPKNIPNWRKWMIVLILASGAHCAAFASTVAALTEAPLSAQFRVSEEVTILGVSLFVLGLGLGPLFLGPLSEVHGRNVMYRSSLFLFFAFTWPTAFPPNIAVYLSFRLLGGIASSAFLTVCGGSISDIFEKPKVSWPMAVWTIAPFTAPADGPFISGLINQNTNWRWTYRILIIWIFIEFLLILTLPETYVPTLLQRKAQRLRKKTGDLRYWAPFDRQNRNIVRAMIISCYMPFKLMAFDGMCLLIDIWGAIVLGLQYLTFQSFPIIFEQGHGFNVQSTGAIFLGMGVGMLIALATQPFFIRYTRRKAMLYDGNPPPEIHLIIGQVGAVIMPISLFWLAFTTYPSIHWIVPELAIVLLGMGVIYCFSSMFTYLVTAYRPVAASAMASHTFLRGTSAAAFPLFGRQMYHKMGTVGATAFLAGLITLAAPLPFIFYHIGHRLREKSRFTIRSST